MIPDDEPIVIPNDEPIVIPNDDPIVIPDDDVIVIADADDENLLVRDSPPAVTENRLQRNENLSKGASQK